MLIMKLCFSQGTKTNWSTGLLATLIGLFYFYERLCIKNNCLRNIIELFAHML